jgi:hypothetical protein
MDRTMMRTGILCAVALAVTACATAPTIGNNEDRTAAWLDAHRDRPPMLRMFLQRMPKGGDLHSHLTGAVYAESYIDWAAQAGLCADPVKRAITSCCPPACPTRPVADAFHDPTFYNALVDELSTRNLANQPQSGHNQFFDAFGRFGAAGAGRSAAMVAEVTSRAADQHVMYLELMLTFRGDEVRKLGGQTAFDRRDFAASRQRLLDAGLRDLVKPATGDLDMLEQRVAAILGCRPDNAPAACRVTRRYLQQSSRTLDPSIVFAQLTYAFELASADRRVVGLNLVAPQGRRRRAARLQPAHANDRLAQRTVPDGQRRASRRGTDARIGAPGGPPIPHS